MKPLKMIRYNTGKWRYILTEDYTYILKGSPRRDTVDHEYFGLIGRKLIIRKGYAWDGATGLPDILQTKSLRLPSLVHDVFCQMTNENLLDWKPWREFGDNLFRKLYASEKQGSKMFVLRMSILYMTIRLNSLYQGYKRGDK